MGAKRKINGARVRGALLVAGLAGLVTGSPPVFVVMLGDQRAADASGVRDPVIVVVRDLPVPWPFGAGAWAG